MSNSPTLHLRRRPSDVEADRFYCCVIDAVFADGEDGQVQSAQAAAPTLEDLAAVEQQVRARVLRCFAGLPKAPRCPLRWECSRRLRG